MQIIYTNYANNYQVILVDCIIITIIIIIVITNVDAVCHDCCYSHLFWLCLGASQEWCPSMPYADKQLVPQRVKNWRNTTDTEEKGGMKGGEAVMDKDSSQGCHSFPWVFVFSWWTLPKLADKGSGEGAMQRAMAGLVWADCEEGIQGHHSWISFAFFSQGHAGVVIPVCVTGYIHPSDLGVWEVCGKSTPIELHFTNSWISAEVLQLPGHAPSRIDGVWGCCFSAARFSMLVLAVTPMSKKTAVTARLPLACCVHT